MITVVRAFVFGVVAFDERSNGLAGSIGPLLSLSFSMTLESPFVIVGKFAPIVLEQFGKLGTTFPTILLVGSARVAGFVTVVAIPLRSR